MDLEQTLNAFKREARHNDIYAVMRAIATQLTRAEIRALAQYYARKGR